MNDYDTWITVSHNRCMNVCVTGITVPYNRCMNDCDTEITVSKERKIYVVLTRVAHLGISIETLVWLCDWVLHELIMMPLDIFRSQH